MSDEIKKQENLDQAPIGADVEVTLTPVDLEKNQVVPAAEVPPVAPAQAAQTAQATEVPPVAPAQAAEVPPVVPAQAVTSSPSLKEEGLPQTVSNEINLEYSPADKRKKNIATIGIVVLIIFLLLPFLLRTLDSNYQPKMIEEKAVVEVKVYNLRCSKTDKTDYFIKETNITSEFVDAKIEKFSLANSFTDLEGLYAADLDVDKLDLTDFNTISQIKSEAITLEQNEQYYSYTVNIDFTKDDKLIENKSLASFTKNYKPQMKAYQDEGYDCSSQEATPVEREKIILVEKR